MHTYENVLLILIYNDYGSASFFCGLFENTELSKNNAIMFILLHSKFDYLIGAHIEESHFNLGGTISQK